MGKFDSKFVIQTFMFKAVIKPHTLIVGDFNTPLSPMDRSIKQKPKRELRDLLEVLNQMDLTDIYRTLHPNRKKIYLFLCTSWNLLEN